MGTPIAVAYSNFVLLEMESEINSPCIYYKRYIDDLFRICPDVDTAEKYVSSFNLICESIQLDAVTIGRSGIFLDVAVTLDKDNIIQTSIYQKSTSKFQYIPPFSAHVTHVFQNWVYNELCRYKIICSSDEDFFKIKYQFLNRLLDRGYSISFFALVAPNVPSRATLLDKITLALNPKPSKIDSTILIDYFPPLIPKTPWNYFVRKAFLKLVTNPKTPKKFETLLANLLSKMYIGKKPSKALSHYLVDSRTSKLSSIQ
jgi:hypothetical protein